MARINTLLHQWVSKNANNIRNFIVTCVNPDIDPKTLDIYKWVEEIAGIGEDRQYEPYFEELQHILNDGSEDLGVPLPPEVIAYKLSIWSDTRVPATNILVRDSQKWLNVFLRLRNWQC